MTSSSFTNAIAAAVLLCACSHNDATSSSSVACASSLATYCATPTQECVEHVDPDNIVASYCASPQSGTDEFGIFLCSDAGFFGIDYGTLNPSTSYYDTSGDLVAVVPDFPATTCTAGPTTFDVPDCRSELVGYECIHDAGAD